MAKFKGPLTILGAPTIKVPRLRLTEEFLYPEVKIGGKTLTKVLVLGSVLNADFEKCQELQEAEYKLTSWVKTCAIVILVAFFTAFLAGDAGVFVFSLGLALLGCFIVRRRSHWQLRWVRRGNWVTRENTGNW